jgi:hypothetical protein
MPWKMQVNSIDSTLDPIIPTDPPTWQNMRLKMSQETAEALLQVHINEGEIVDVNVRILEY